MANFRALTIQSGTTKQVADADAVNVGSGIDSNGALVQLTVGAANANGIVIGRAGTLTQITGDLNQDTGTFGLTGSAASSISTTAGNLAIDSAASLFLGAITSPAVTLGRAGAGVITTIHGDFTNIDGVSQLNLGTGTAASVVIGNGASLIGFYGGPAAAKPTIAGVLSAVVDANALAVLTSIIAALASGTGVNLATDATT